MPDIGNIGSVQNHGSIDPSNRINVDQLMSRMSSSEQPHRVESSQDRVELSEHARHLDRIRQLPDIRQSLVNDIRSAIENGAYDTDGKLELAIDKLVEEFEG